MDAARTRGNDRHGRDCSKKHSEGAIFAANSGRAEHRAWIKTGKREGRLIGDARAERRLNLLALSAEIWGGYA
jgi:hypothetical protein